MRSAPFVSPSIQATVIAARTPYTPTGLRLEALSGTPLGTLEQQFAYAGGERLPDPD